MTAPVRPIPQWLGVFRPLLPADQRKKLDQQAEMIRNAKERAELARVISKEARLYERIVIATLARLGFCWRPSTRYDDEKARKRARLVRVKIELIRFNEAAIYYKVAVRKRGLLGARDELPYRTTVRDLMSEETAQELSAACERIVKAKFDPTKGAWYVVYRNEAGGLLPRLVRYHDMLPHYPPDLTRVPMIIGVGENNTIHEVNIEDYPHGLIAGASNSGKSNMLNNMLSTLIRFTSPSDCQFIMVDPKKVELRFYEDAPHLARPIIYDVQTAIEMLAEVSHEIDRRTEELRRCKVKKISTYNARFPDHPMSRLFVVIEELASLWDVPKFAKRVQMYLQRIANMGRAAGVHLILCTQVPTKEIIPTKLKENLWIRICGRVSSPIGSMVVLGTGDAAWLEAIPGRMVYAIDADKHVIQTPYITDADVELSVAIARGKAEGLITYVQLHVNPQPEAILQRIVTACNGSLSIHVLGQYFGQYAITRDMLKPIVEEVKARDEIQIGANLYRVKRVGQGAKLELMVEVIKDEKPAEKPEKPRPILATLPRPPRLLPPGPAEPEPPDEKLIQELINDLLGAL